MPLSAVTVWDQPGLCETLLHEQCGAIPEPRRQRQKDWVAECYKQEIARPPGATLRDFVTERKKIKKGKEIGWEGGRK